MANRTLTSANSTFTLAVTGLYAVPVSIQGYAVDNMFEIDAAEVADVQMGADGKLSGGYTPTPRKLTVHLQADSPSRELFRVWDSAQRNTKDLYTATGVITIPSLSETYTLVRGFLQTVNVMPGAKKVLQPTDYVIMFESVITASI